MKKLNQSATVAQYVDLFIETGETINRVRDIWYHFKREFQELSQAENWDSTCNSYIGDALWKRYLGGDIEVYNRLDIPTKGLNGEATGTMPLVIFSEKATRESINASEALSCCRYSSSGQIPSFEVAHIAEYLAKTAINNFTYLVGITDYDPSGGLIYNTLVGKVEKALEVINPDLIFLHEKVAFGSSYDDITSRYPTYTLGTGDKSGNVEWIRAGHLEGVELNVVDDKKELLETAIMRKIKPRFLKDLSEKYLKSSKYWSMHIESAEIEELQAKIAEIEERLHTEVDAMEITFTPEWGDSISKRSVENMSEFTE